MDTWNQISGILWVETHVKQFRQKFLGGFVLQNLKKNHTVSTGALLFFQWKWQRLPMP